MNKEIKKDSDSKKIFSMIILIATLMVCTTSATYAYFAINATNTNTVTGTAATASLTLTVNKIRPTETGSGRLVPQDSVANSTNILKLAVDAGCIDDNDNLVCQVYTIVLTNGGTSNVTVDGDFALTAAGMTNLKWYLLAEGEGATPTTTYTYPTNLPAAGYGNAKTVTALETSLMLNGTTTGTTASRSHYYVVAVWIEETGAAQTDSGTFTGSIAFTPSDGSAGITSTITG